MNLSKKEEAEVMRVYDTWLTTYLNGDIKTYDSFLDDDYRFIGSTNNEEFLNRRDTTNFFKITADQFAGKTELRNTFRTIKHIDGLILITHLFDAYFLSGNDWAYYGRFRFTSALRKKGNKWKFIYQHFSMPDSKAQEGETIGYEKVAAENLQLKDAIKRRTIELEYKNRELEIEAATERVRVQSMAMQHPKDLEKVNKELLTQLTKLEIAGLSGVSFYFIDQDEIVTVWDLSSPGNMTYPNSYSFRYDSKKFPILGELVGILKSTKEDYFVLDFPKDKLLLAIEELKHININIANIATTAIDSGALLHQWNPTARITDGILSIDLMMPPTDDTKIIVLKMAGAFNQAYQRFLDLQKAEAQAREAQIEAALERVRSRTLAMQKSEELAETAAVLFKQLIGLGIEPNRLYITIIQDEEANAEFWITDEDGSKVSSVFEANLHHNLVLKKMLDGWKEKKISLTIDMHGQELKDYFDFLTSLHVPFKDGLTQTRRIQYLGYFNKGFIGMASPDDQPEETVQLLARFAAVFNLTFTRFNDLQIAEAHALQAEQDLIAIKEAKQKAEDALAELQVTQKQLIQSEKMASLGELTAGIAHEIQNPLNFVNNFSEVSNELIDEMNAEIEKGDIEEAKAIAKDIKLNLEKINHHGKRADAIVKGMLQHSRSSSAVKEPTDINKLADEYLRLAYHGLRAKDKSFNASMITEYDENIGNINIIPQDIGRVILNLITNAFYTVSEKKKQNLPGYEPIVTVCTKRSGDKVEVSVKDNGNGIPQKVMDKIFQPFFTTKPTGEGTGLGLSMSYDMITKGHNGELIVETEEGEYAEFTIVLPI